MTGQQGDFITSPESKQSLTFTSFIFIWTSKTNIHSQLIALHYIHYWNSIGKPSKIQWIELGPGKGTLMKDLLTVQP